MDISSHNLTMIHLQRVRFFVLYIFLGGLLEFCYGNFPQWVRINKTQFRNPLITYGVIECNLEKTRFFHLLARDIKATS